MGIMNPRAFLYEEEPKPSAQQPVSGSNLAEAGTVSMEWDTIGRIAGERAAHWTDWFAVQTNERGDIGGIHM